MNTVQNPFKIKNLILALPVVSFIPYVYFTFFNVDPLHDGWFSAPGTAIANGAMPYKDVITSYGWVSPVFFSLIVKAFGFHLVYFRIVGLALHALICVAFFLIARHFLDSRFSSAIISLWLLINLGQMSRDPDSLPAWGFWPNQIIVLFSLYAIYYLAVKEDFRMRTILVFGVFGGIAPWVRAQGLLLFAAIIIVVTHHLWSKKSTNFVRTLVYFGTASIFSLTLPLFWIIKNSALKNFLWQTIEMPRTGEWVGMPNPFTWLIQNIGLSFIFLIWVMLCSYLVTRFELSHKIVVGAITISILLLSRLRVDSDFHSTNLIFRKIQTLSHLYLDYNFFTFPLLIMLALFIVMIFYQGFQYLKSNKEDLQSGFNVYILSIPAVTLIYYNFGHLWGVTPLILLSLVVFLANKKRSFLIVKRTVTILFTYSFVVSALALPQIYGRMLVPSYSYDSPGLELMRGQNIDQVKEVSRSVRLINKIPEGEKVFFLCENALFSVAGNRFVSDNIFYGTSMTKFNRRPEIFQIPQISTRYLVYCPGSNTIDVSKIPGKWLLAETSSGSNFSGLRIYKRGSE